MMFQPLDMRSLPWVLTKPFNVYRPPHLHYGLGLAFTCAEAYDILDKYNKSLELDDKDKTPLMAQIVYGCSTGDGWIVNFGHTKRPRLVDETIIKRVVHMHGQGEPKWFLS
jgi:hypothetical protein